MLFIKTFVGEFRSPTLKRTHCQINLQVPTKFMFAINARRKTMALFHFSESTNISKSNETLSVYCYSNLFLLYGTMHHFNAIALWLDAWRLEKCPVSLVTNLFKFPRHRCPENLHLNYYLWQLGLHQSNSSCVCKKGKVLCW